MLGTWLPALARCLGPRQAQASGLWSWRAGTGARPLVPLMGASATRLPGLRPWPPGCRGPMSGTGGRAASYRDRGAGPVPRATPGTGLRPVVLAGQHRGQAAALPCHTGRASWLALPVGRACWQPGRQQPAGASGHARHRPPACGPGGPGTGPGHSTAYWWLAAASAARAVALAAGAGCLQWAGVLGPGSGSHGLAPCSGHRHRPQACGPGPGTAWPTAWPPQAGPAGWPCLWAGHAGRPGCQRSHGSSTPA